ncbi:16502_t:CDS:2 [Acaulospora morrowiae]|uniref:mRNA export factor GLE1 n=1 Tax=Acaulospora morrowiae TaxID=94023 RepID=A0A9N9NCD2_9GLOM|nr:16502_t:CDS:2 [Acaulospora morrowiae]
MLAEAKKAQEAAQAAAEAKKKSQEATQPATGTKGSKSLGSEEALKEEERHRSMLKNINEKLAKVPQLKTATLESRKKIKLKLNILTNSRTEILKIADEISNVLNSSKSSNINVYYFLLNFLAKELIKHAEVDILSNESSAFSFAHVSVLIAAWHTEFLNFLMARFVKKCPYVLPRYFDIREMDKMSVADFRKHIGYKDGEREDIYIKRMCSILALYCAIMQTQPIHPNLKNPYSIDHAWTYLARLMNLKPKKITPFLLCTCIQITGAELIRVYRDDALKLFSVVCKAYVLQPPPEVRELLTISPSAMSRLKTMLENASQKGGRFPYPDGRDPL